MARIWDGVWVYLLTMALLIILGIFIFYRHLFPENSLEKLTQLRASATSLRDSPCASALVGEPSILKGDNYIKVNIYCPDGSTSTNVLRFSTLPPNPTVRNLLQIISAIDNFDVKYTPDQQSFTALGQLENSDQNRWTVKINQPIKGEVLSFPLHPQDWIEIRYEKI